MDGDDTVVLRALGLGDLCAAVPALRAVRRATRGRLVVATDARLQPLLELADVTCEVIDQTGLARPLPARLRGCGLAVNLHGQGPQSTALLAALGPGRLVAYDADGWDPEAHEVVRWCRLVETQLGVAADPDDLQIRPPAGIEPPDPAGAPPVVIHPGAASGSRRWPLARYGALARRLAADGLPVVVTGGPGESASTACVARAAASTGRAVDLGGCTDLLGLVGAVAAAQLVICGDTGVAHLATALGRPSVVLFGPTPPSQWGPRRGPHTVLWRGSTGDPHGSQIDPGLLGLGVEEVWQAAVDRLSAAA